MLANVLLVILMIIYAIGMFSLFYVTIPQIPIYIKTTFCGYRAVLVENIEPFSKLKRVLITKDGKIAHDPTFPTTFRFAIEDDGNARWAEFDFYSAKWKYI